MSDPTFMADPTRLVIAAIVGIALLLALIIKFKLHPVLSMMVSALATGIGAGMPLDLVADTVTKGVGTTLQNIALLIGLGSMFGQILEESGGAKKIAQTFIDTFGQGHSSWALGITGLVIGTLGVDLGTMILVGIPTAFIAMAIAGVIWGRNVGGRIFTDVPEHFTSAEGASDEKELPSFGMVLAIVLTPLCLILLGTLPSYIPMPAELASILAFLGKPFVALTLATLVAMYLLGARRGYSGAELKALLDRSLKPVGMILLVIACGGVIRWMLQDCGLGQVIGPMLEASPLPLVVVAFLIAVMVRASVGSSIVAMTMASGIMAAMPAVAGASVLMRAAICLAICGGATALSHVNDAGFWMCSSFLEIDEKTTLKSWTVMETLIGLSGLACALVISFFA